jgi:hypothetical protein
MRGRAPPLVSPDAERDGASIPADDEGCRQTDHAVERVDLACPFRLTQPGVRRTGCGCSSGAPALAPTGHPARTHVFRVVFQTLGGRRLRRTALTGRPEPSAWPVPHRRPDGLTPPGACSDDGGLRPSASRRFGLRQGAPPVVAPGRPSLGRGVCGPRGNR